MSTGVKESNEIAALVVGLVNVLADIGTGGISAYVEKIGSLLRVAQLAGPAIGDASKALQEAIDGYSAEEKAVLFRTIEALELPSESVEKVAEGVLKVGVALTDLVELVRGIKAAAVAA
jgi:hypothetical protein